MRVGRNAADEPQPGNTASDAGMGCARVAFVGEAALVAGVVAGNPTAMAELYDRFAAPILRILSSVLGPDPELADVHHDVFVRALQSIGSLRDPQSLQRWMSSVAVHTAHASIERRVRRRRWLVFAPEDTLRALPAAGTRADDDAREALRAAYAVLDRMPTEERMAFALRYIEGLELLQVAETCEVSLATIKRRLARAEKRFGVLARAWPALAEYLEGGEPWHRR